MAECVYVDTLSWLSQYKRDVSLEYWLVNLVLYIYLAFMNTRELTIRLFGRHCLDL